MADDGDFEVTTESLDAMAATLRAESNRIETALATLEREAALLQSQWDGAARAAYQEAQSEWSARFADMKAILERIASTTEEISSDYTDTDAELASMFDD